VSELDAVPSGWGRFPTTCWSRVIAAGDPGDPDARAALEGLCRDYWYPLYAFVRRKGHGPEEARDLVQGLFARLLERDGLSGLDPDRGRFRSFLMVCCANHLADCHDRAAAARRGGGRPPVPIVREEAEAKYALEPSHGETPQRIYERRWALELLRHVLGRLDAEAAGSRHPELFARLRPMLEGDEHAPSLRRVAAELGMTEGAVQVAAHRLRARYRALLRQEVARTTRDGDEVEDELAVLLAALGD
jgi:RNA polymerase sigma-70 factor (ECF subfamily)